MSDQGQHEAQRPPSPEEGLEEFFRLQREGLGLQLLLRYLPDGSTLEDARLLEERMKQESRAACSFLDGPLGIQRGAHQVASSASPASDLVRSAFEKVAAAVNLSHEEQARLLAAGEEEERMSLCVGAFMLAEQAFPGDGGGWLRRPNTAPLFGGEQPLAWALPKGSEAFCSLMDHLALSQEGGEP